MTFLKQITRRFGGWEKGGRRLISSTLPAVVIPFTGLAAAEPHPSLPPPVIPECLGVNIHFTDPKPGELEMLAAAGFKWVRMDFSWGGTERKKGEYDFSAYDRLVAALAKHGIRALFILDYGNPLYDGGLSPASDEGRAAFARWAVTGVRHFAGKGFLWEMWNEPNGGFWKPKADVKQYAALARATGEALRTAGLLGPKGEAYIGPATSTIDLPFLEGCFQAGLLEFWDAVSVHPYRQGAPESAEEEYRSLRLLIRKYAPEDKAIPIISGEWGYSNVWQNFTPELQGKYLSRQFLTNIANDVALSIWYDWHDDGTNPRDQEHHFGMVANEYHAGREPVYDPKPAYVAMKTLNSQLAGFRFDRTFIPGADSQTLGDEMRICLFKKNLESRLATWRLSKSPVSFDIPAIPGPFEAIDSSGNSAQLTALREKGLHFTAEDTPTYLVPGKPDDALEIIASTPRLPLEVEGRAPSSVTLPGAGALELRGRPSRPKPIDINYSVKVEGFLSFTYTQRTYFVCDNPLEAEAYPGSQGDVFFQVRNPSGEPFDGKALLVRESDHQTLVAEPLVFVAGEKEKTIKLSGGNGAEGPLTVVVSAKVGGTENDELCLKLPLGVIRPAPDHALDSATVHADGDARVESQQSLSGGQPPGGTAPSGGDSVCLHYKAAAGWKFFEVSAPQTAIPPINEHAPPKEAASFPTRFGIWIHGDAKGCLVRARFKDKSGQVFQPSGPKIDWTGWRYVTFPMVTNEKTPLAHWGGANDGEIHYPFQWDSPFLLDNVSREAVEGTIYISAPTLIYEYSTR